MNSQAKKPTGECPDQESLRELLHGTLSAAVEAELASHLSLCAECQQRIEMLAGTADFKHRQPHLAALSGGPPSQLRDLLTNLTDEPAAGDVEVELSSLLSPSPNPAYMGMFGPYEIFEVVGRGGMGIVLKARDPGLDRVVAIKTLLPQIALSPKARGRFLREAKNAAAVNHPNIVTIHSVDLLNGTPYLVMEFVQGHSLEQQLASGPISEAELLRISHQIAQALAAAHAQGLIHRDIKPANILLENGVPKVKVTDFGLSRAMNDTDITRPGTVAGTPQFMSPEQAEGKPTNSKSDLFSLGTVMYSMCTGQPAFDGETSLAVIRRVCDATPTAIRAINPAAPVWAERIVQRLMRKNPDRRPTAQDVVQLLNDQMLGKARNAATRWPALTVIALLVCTVAWMYGRRLEFNRPNGGVPRSTSVGLASPLPRTATNDFTIVGGDQRFGSLPAAAAAAADGDVIRILGNGPYDCPLIKVRDKSLTIEAAEDVRPVLMASHEAGHILETNAPLTLRGLELLPRKSFAATVQFKHSVVRTSGARFAMDRCTVRGGTGVSAVGLTCETAEIRRSYIECPNASGIVARPTGTGSLSLDHCVLNCRVNVTPIIVSTLQSYTIHVRNSTLAGGLGIRLVVDSMPTASLTSGDKGLLNVATEQALFDLRYAFVAMPPRGTRARDPVSALDRILAWKDDKSFYTSTTQPAAYSLRREMVAFFPPPEEWQQWREYFAIANQDAVLGTVTFKSEAANQVEAFSVTSTEPRVEHAVGADVGVVGPWPPSAATP